eukprot:1190930-Prorocentrum_minimum.AAC.2
MRAAPCCSLRYYRVSATLLFTRAGLASLHTVSTVPHFARASLAPPCRVIERGDAALSSAHNSPSRRNVSLEDEKKDPPHLPVGGVVGGAGDLEEAELGGGTGAGHEDVDGRHLVGGKGARLVGADDGGAAERLHRGQLAHDGVLLRHLARAQRQAGGDHRRQALRDRRLRTQRGTMSLKEIM